MKCVMFIFNTDVDKEEIEAIPINRYRDPGHYLEAPKLNGIKNGLEERGPSAEVVRGLACALLQVSQAIHHKYLKRPLGKYTSFQISCQLKVCCTLLF